MSWNLFHNQTHLKLSVISALASLFIISGAISVLFPSSILDTFQPEGLIFQCYVFLHFHALYWFLKPRILELFAISSSRGAKFGQNSLTYPSWVDLHKMTHSFIALCKPLCHDKAVMHERNPDAVKNNTA